MPKSSELDSIFGLSQRPVPATSNNQRIKQKYQWNVDYWVLCWLTIHLNGEINIKTFTCIKARMTRITSTIRQTLELDAKAVCRSKSMLETISLKQNERIRRLFAINCIILFSLFTSLPSLMSWTSNFFDVGLHGTRISSLRLPSKAGILTRTRGCLRSFKRIHSYENWNKLMWILYSEWKMKCFVSYLQQISKHETLVYFRVNTQNLYQFQRNFSRSNNSRHSNNQLESALENFHMDIFYFHWMNCESLDRHRRFSEWNTKKNKNK